MPVFIDRGRKVVVSVEGDAARVVVERQLHVPCEPGVVELSPDAIKDLADWARKQWPPKPDDDPRRTIVRLAWAEMGRNNPKPYIVECGLPESFTGSWCGIFALAMLRRAGITEANWIIGKGFIGPLKLPQTKDPKPADIAYFAKNQHQAIVTQVGYDSVWLIQGNGYGGRVTTSGCVPRSKPTAYFSLQPLIDAMQKEHG